MRTDADQMIRKMAALSMYNKTTEPVQQIETKGLCDDCLAGNQCKSLLFHDGKENLRETLSFSEGSESSIHEIPE